MAHTFVCMSHTVLVEGISKSFGDHHVLQGIDLAIESGTVFGLLGPNGAGKTTLVKILATLVPPDSGSATIAGHDLRTDPLGVKRSISLTGQFAAIDEVLTGRENLEMMAQLLKVPRRETRSTVTRLLDTFDLTAAADRRAGTYSGGMARRLDLAISLLIPPKLLFLDEPTNGLDPRSREQLWGTVRALVADGVTVLLTTQYLEEADQLADRIGVINHGTISALGTADELKNELGGELIRLQFTDRASTDRAARIIGSTTVDGRLNTVEIPSSGTASDVQSVLNRLADAGVPAAKVSVHRPSLEDVFRSLTDNTETELASCPR